MTRNRPKALCGLFLILLSPFLRCSGYFKKPANVLLSNTGVCQDVIINGLDDLASLRDCKTIEGSLEIYDIKNKNGQRELKDLSGFVFPNLTEIGHFLVVIGLNNTFLLADMLPNLSLIRGEKLISTYAIVILNALMGRKLYLPSLNAVLRGQILVQSAECDFHRPPIKWIRLLSAKNSDVKLITESLSDSRCYRNSCPAAYNDTNSDLCPSECNSGCTKEGKCCSSQCLYGCHKPYDPTECLHCKHLNRDKICVDANQCSNNKIRFGNSCINKKECSRSNLLIRVAQECLRIQKNEQCPNEYRIDATGNCIPLALQCKTAYIHNIDDALMSKNCKSIDHLVIERVIGDPDFVSKELSNILSNLRIIRGYLVVRDTKFTDLSFLSNIHVIEGTTGLYKNESALVIKNNKLLRTLDDITNLSISNLQNLISAGHSADKIINFNSNERLCQFVVDNFQRKLGRTSVSVNNTSDIVEQNGSKQFCIKNALNASVEPSTNSRALELTWYFPDSIQVSSYFVYFSSLKTQNFSDFCHQKNWERVEVLGSYHPMKYNLTNLNPSTQYTLYVQTNAIKDWTSDMLKATTTAEPKGIIVKSESPNSFAVSWSNARHQWDSFYVVNLKMKLRYQTPISAPWDLNHKRLTTAGTESLKLSNSGSSENNLLASCKKLESCDCFGASIEKIHKYTNPVFPIRNTFEYCEGLFKNSFTTNHTSITIIDLPSGSLQTVAVYECHEMKEILPRQCQSCIFVGVTSATVPHRTLSELKSLIRFEVSIQRGKFQLNIGIPIHHNIAYMRLKYYALAKPTEFHVLNLSIWNKSLSLEASDLQHGNVTLLLTIFNGVSNIALEPRYIQNNIIEYDLQWKQIISGVFLLIGAICPIVFIKYYINEKKKTDFLKCIEKTIIAAFRRDQILERQLLSRKKNRISLGKGQFGLVFEARYNEAPCAIKTTKAGGKKQNFINESKLSLTLRTEHIVKFLGIVLDHDGLVYLVMELMDLGDLQQYLKKQTYISEERKIAMALQVADGMAYLTSKKIIHRDLSAKNCLLTKKRILKISDFGIAIREFDQPEPNEGLPIRWMAPESLDKNIFSYKSDVWSYGVLLWEIWNRGKKPYEEKTHEDVIKAVICRFKLYVPILPICLNYSPIDRPTFVDICNVLVKMKHEDKEHFEKNSFFHKMDFSQPGLSTQVSETSSDRLTTETTWYYQDSSFDSQDPSVNSVSGAMPKRHGQTSNPEPLGAMSIEYHKFPSASEMETGQGSISDNFWDSLLVPWSPAVNRDYEEHGYYNCSSVMVPHNAHTILRKNSISEGRYVPMNNKYTALNIETEQ